MRPDALPEPAVRLVTLDDAARMLSCSREYIELLVKRGDLPRVRLGRAVRIEVAELDAYIVRQRDRNNLRCSESSETVEAAA